MGEDTSVVILAQCLHCTLCPFSVPSRPLQLYRTGLYRLQAGTQTPLLIVVTFRVQAMQCASCGQNQAALGAPMWRCGACHQACYCNRSCQKIDWKHHRHLCKRTVAEESAVVDLTVTIRLLSGASRPMEGCKYDDAASLLEQRVIDWASQLMDFDKADYKATLSFRGSVLRGWQTLRQHGLVDGAEITAVVEPDLPPPLIDTDSDDPPLVDTDSD